ncbi:MAG: GNAT family N-acetyltransferase [Bradyrhizobium sp.]|jgi:N-acetylglutamate synthase-like GNAT family acetyltransferase
MSFTISNLREFPEFFSNVADRVWNFTWKSKGVSLEQVAAGLRGVTSNDKFPFVIVAHDGDHYAGSALGIASDMDERPQYTPWVAAVWVEPQYRRQNVGRSLVSHATETCLKQGFQKVFLCARPERHEFYTRQGWSMIELEVGEKRLNVYVKCAPTL